jgi:hypothetical protein
VNKRPITLTYEQEHTTLRIADNLLTSSQDKQDRFYIQPSVLLNDYSGLEDDQDTVNIFGRMIYFVIVSVWNDIDLLDDYDFRDKNLQSCV